MTWYCPLPFKHAFIDSTGVAACCRTQRHDMPIDQWINSDYLKNFQGQILNGQIPTQCQKCVSDEEKFGHSLRTGSLADYPGQIFTSTDIDFIDYRSNNICNFKCRSCAPVFSHGIANEVKKSATLQKYFVVPETKTVNVSEHNVRWIEENLNNIKRLQLTGGEPTFMPEVKSLLERAMIQNPDINIMITTNASFVDDFWCEFTRRAKNLHWTVSLDAVEEAAEIVRHGTRWSTVERNIRWLVQHAPSVNFNTVITNLNVLQLKPLLKFVLNMQKESRYPRGLHGNQGCRHQFAINLSPSYLAADNWPPELKPKVCQQLEQCLKLELDQEQRQAINGLLLQIQQQSFDIALWNRSKLLNDTIDQLRNEDHTLLFTPAE